MQATVLQAKLYRPPIRPTLVPRPHLIAKMNRGLSGKLTLVSAPAGFGKTTLVVTWLNQQESPVAWISLDDFDDDPRRFFTYLITACQQNLPNFDSDLSRLLQLPVQDIGWQSVVTARFCAQPLAKGLRRQLSHADGRITLLSHPERHVGVRLGWLSELIFVGRVVQWRRLLFAYFASFNSDLSGWNVSKGVDFKAMFYRVKNFNSDLSNWDLSRARDLSQMFSETARFNSDVSNWNVSMAQDFSWTQSATQYIDLYQQVVAARQGAAPAE